MVIHIRQLGNGDTHLQGLSRKISRRSGAQLIGALLTCSALSGCFGADKTVVVKDIGAFGEAISSASILYKEFYASLNSDDVRTFNLILSSNPDCKLEPVYGSSTAFCPTLRNWGDSPYTQSLISPEALSARIDLLETMALYSASLASLATDDSPSKFRTSVQDLSGSLLSIQDRFERLPQGAAQGIKSPKDYIGPISTLIGLTGGIAMEASRWSAIRDVVIKSNADVTTIIDYLSSDLRVAEAQFVLNQERRFIELERYFRKMQSSPSFGKQQRAELLDQMSALHLARQKLSLASPASSLANIKKAHQKLVKAATTNDLASISELRAYLAAFETDLVAIRDAIFALKSLK